MTNILDSGQILPKGGTLVSPNGTYTLTMQVDGNLVLTKNGTQIWATGTSGSHVVCNMETSGDLFVNGIIPWQSGTFSPGAYLVLQNDGTLAIDSVAGVQIWSPPEVLVLLVEATINGQDSASPGAGE